MTTCNLMHCQKIIALTSLLQKYRLHNIPEICISLSRLQTNDNKYTTVDLIDDFTKSLVKQKSVKWNSMNMSKPIPKETFTPIGQWKLDFKSKLKNISNNKLDIDIITLSTEQLDSLVLGALEAKRLDDVEYLVMQFIDNEQCPSLDVLLDIFSVYSQNGNVKMVKSLQRFYKVVNPAVSSDNSDFNHFLARSHWMKGNVQMGLQLFLDVYKNNVTLRFPIKKMLKRLIYDTVLNRSEASVVILNKYVILFGTECQEWYPLSCFWENCWLSEWFCDQQLADSLFKDHKQLRYILNDYLFPMSIGALRNHQEDAVIRLLQLTLHFEMQFHSTRIIQALFNYRSRRNDINGCSEIIQTCSTLKIHLTSLQYKRYLHMMIDNDDTPASPNTSKLKQPAPADQYRLKF